MSPRVDLASTFKNPGREMAEPSTVDSVPADVPVVEDRASAPLSSTRSADAVDVAPRRRGRPRTRPVGERATLVLWLPVGLRDRLRAATTSRKGATMLTVTLDALEDQADHLPGLVAATGPQIVRGKLFERQAPAPEQPGGPKVQVTIRGALPSHLDVIDSLVASTGATSRSALVAAALDEYLPRRPRALR